MKGMKFLYDKFCASGEEPNPEQSFEVEVISEPFAMTVATSRRNRSDGYSDIGSESIASVVAIINGKIEVINIGSLSPIE